MLLPACDVPTHAEWKSLRDKAGGKEGLAKVNMGRKLDEFHGALKADDVAKATAAVKTMDAAAKAYSAEVAKKFPKVAAVVNAEIVAKLKAFDAAISAKEKGREDRLESMGKKMKADLMTVIATSNKFIADLKKMEADLDGVLAKFKDGVPAAQVPVVRKFVDTYRKAIEKYFQEGGKLETMAKSLSMGNEAVKAKFEQAIDTSIDLLEQRRQQIARNQKLLARLDDLVAKAKPA